VRAILEKAGFKDIRISAHDQAVTSGDLDTMTTVLLKVGPLGRIVRENPELRRSAETRVQQRSQRRAIRLVSLCRQRPGL
jgi:hypothetical protein